MKREYIIALLFSLLHVCMSGDIRMSIFTATLDQIVWTNQTTAVMLGRGSIWRSVDEGFTWTQSLPDNLTNVNQIIQDYADPKKLYIYRGATSGYLTVDGGATYVVTENPGSLRSLDIHSTQSGWFLAVSWSGEIKMSDDMGLTWGHINTGAYTAGWYRADAGNLPVQSFFTIDTSLRFNISTDLGATTKTIFNKAVGFIVAQDYVYVGILDTEDNDLMLRVCTSDANSGDPNSYRLAEFSFGDEVAQNSYAILDDDEGAIWIALNEGAKSWGNIYTSGSLGYQYVSSLSHASAIHGVYDHTKVAGLHGIHIANNITNWQEDSESNPDLRTIVTFDNGGEWRYLVAPAYDSTGNPTGCTGSCSLNVNGLSGFWFKGAAPFYTTPNAIGLVLATGNTGSSLAHNYGDYNTYLSRDAGLSWIELVKGAYIYEFGDHGGIIIMASNDPKDGTSQIMYSLEEGADLKIYELGVEVFVSNIISEPSATGLKFMLLGTATKSSSNGQYADQDVIIGLDFTELRERTCAEDDYEEWSPSDGVSNSSCLLGQNVVYSRKKQSADCFNDRQTEHIISSTPCACTYEDWECDFGYKAEKTIPGAKPVCVLVSAVSRDPPSECPPDTFYYVSRGYRKVPGDQCVGGEDLGPIKKSCPASTPDTPTSSKTWIAIVVVVVVLAVAFVGIGIFIYNNEEVRGKIAGFFRGGQQTQYSRLGAGGSLVGDSEFGIAENDLSDDEEDAQVLHDNDIATKATTEEEFNPRS